MTTIDQDLQARFAGELLEPASPGYDEARQVWNGMIDRHPDLIARCTGVDDVVEAVRFAGEHRLGVAVRGGGHNVAGTAVRDGGLVIDLSPMREVTVDPERRRVRAQGGATWADVDREAQRFGLATPGGKVSETGIAGLTLGGGLGWLRRRHGLACDNLVAAEVVTADGTVVTTSEDERPELLWALRGGGGGVGVVTTFEYVLHPVGPDVSVALVYYDGQHAAPVTRAFREMAGACPDEISALCLYGTVPDDESFPEASRGRTAVIVVACHSGDLGEGAEALRPLRELAEPIADMSDTMTYLDVQTIFDEDYPSGELRYYWTSAYLDGLDDATIDLLIDHGARAPSRLSTVDIWQLGGAIARVAPEATAHGHRDAPFMIGIEANWADSADDAANLDWARTLAAALRDRAQRGSYLNFPGFFEDGEDQVRGALDANYERLTAVREQYDPTALFRTH